MSRPTLWIQKIPLTPDQIPYTLVHSLREILVVVSGEETPEGLIMGLIVNESSSIVQMDKREDVTDIFLSSGKSLQWTPKDGWICYNDYTRRQKFPFKAEVFMA